MSDPVDPERLAALLDNRLDPKARDEVVRQLATSDEALDAFADAAAVLREIEEEDSRSGSVSPSSPFSSPSMTPARAAASRRWFRSPALRAALAAAIVIAVVIPITLRTRNTSATGASTSVEALSVAAGLPSTWNSAPWSARRGDNAPLTPSARAVRLGARLTDLELSIRARDTMSKIFADDAATLLADLPVSGPAVSAMRAVGSDTSALQRFFAARRMAESLVDRTPLDEGSWLEAARIAASRRDAPFFRATTSSQVAKSTLGDADRALVTRAIQARAADTSAWTELETRLTELLAERAR